MKSGIITGAIVLTVSIILVGTVLMSALDVADEEFNPVFENKSENGIRMKVVESATISKAAGEGSKVTINDKTVDLNTIANAIVLTDTFVINARTTNFYVISTVASNVNAATAFTATIGNGTITYQIGTASEVTLTYSGDLLVADPDGDMINFTSGSIYYDNADHIYGWNWSSNKLYVSKGADCTVAGTPGASTNLNASEDGQYDDLYILKVADVKLDSSGDEVTPVTMIGPISVESTLSVGNGVTPIIAVIPIMLIVAIVMMAVAIFIRRAW